MRGRLGDDPELLLPAEPVCTLPFLKDVTVGDAAQSQPRERESLAAGWSLSEGSGMGTGEGKALYDLVSLRNQVVNREPDIRETVVQGGDEPFERLPATQGKVGIVP